MGEQGEGLKQESFRIPRVNCKEPPYSGEDQRGNAEGDLSEREEMLSRGLRVQEVMPTVSLSSPHAVWFMITMHNQYSYAKFTTSLHYLDR